MKQIFLAAAMCGLLTTAAHAQNPMMQRTMMLLDLAAGIEGYKHVCPQNGFPKMSDDMFDAIIMRLAGQGLIPSGTLPEEFAAQIRKEIDKRQRISRFATAAYGLHSIMWGRGRSAGACGFCSCGRIVVFRVGMHL